MTTDEHIHDYLTKISDTDKFVQIITSRPTKKDGVTLKQYQSVVSSHAWKDKSGVSRYDIYLLQNRIQQDNFYTTYLPDNTQLQPKFQSMVSKLEFVLPRLVCLYACRNGQDYSAQYKHMFGEEHKEAECQPAPDTNFDVSTGLIEQLISVNMELSELCDVATSLSSE